MTASEPPLGWAGKLYQKLANVDLDPANVHRIREAVIEREDVHLSLDDGTIAFTRSVDGHITGALFEGDGEILLLPPDRVERWSLGQFMGGAAILEERFSSAYLLFNDDTFTELEPYLRPADPDDVQPFLTKWNPVAQALASRGALRILTTLVDSTRTRPDGSTEYSRNPNDRAFYARLVGRHIGAFDVYYDTKAPEQIVVGRLTVGKTGEAYYDIWTSFPSRSVRKAAAGLKGSRSRFATITTQTGAEMIAPDPIEVSNYKLDIQVKPPRTLEVDGDLELEVKEAGHRFLRFELSRSLHVNEVAIDGKPVEFIQNPSLRGSTLDREGNDVVAFVLPEPAQPGVKLHMHIRYGGDVMAEAGGGLMYVGARGIWYPNRGIAMSNFDLTFHYPHGWTLLATGKRVEEPQTAQAPDGSSEQVARFVSERPIPVAGFNLGQYARASSKAGKVLVESYAGHGMESAFKAPQTVMVLPGMRPGSNQREAVVVSTPPTPAAQAQHVADQGARAIEWYSSRYGPYAYSSLALTQMPGVASQGWPGLIFLSSYVFLTPEERAQLNMPTYANLGFGQIMEPHEIGHQWFGDLLVWKSYREQWLVEALSEYSALLMLEEQDERKFHELLDQKRNALLAKNPEGEEVGQAGPVTLGVRLSSSRFPHGYLTIAYGRGAWLFQMLREMLLNPGPGKNGTTPAVKRGSPDEPFFRVLRKVREQYEGKDITTRDLQRAFEEELPPQLWYEGRKSLDWFFDGWVNGTSIPKFELADVRISSKGGRNTATGKILLKDAIEGLVTSMPLYASGSKGETMLGRIFVEDAETPFRFTVPAGTKKILLDPYDTVLKRP